MLMVSSCLDWDLHKVGNGMTLKFLWAFALVYEECVRTGFEEGDIY